ncbi:hypothetical protein [Xanthomonas arboricola]|uniref:hypothetical protein n=1 Tax=Xanthomonas arboricola TaxID=56448 RepID=UPI001FD75201|nr:hypothetical protein [Xanthomonas arboricola]
MTQNPLLGLCRWREGGCAAGDRGQDFLGAPFGDVLQAADRRLLKAKSGAIAMGETGDLYDIRVERQRVFRVCDDDPAIILCQRFHRLDQLAHLAIAGRCLCAQQALLVAGGVFAVGIDVAPIKLRGTPQKVQGHIGRHGKTPDAVTAVAGSVRRRRQRFVGGVGGVGCAASGKQRHGSKQRCAHQTRGGTSQRNSFKTAIGNDR